MIFKGQDCSKHYNFTFEFEWTMILHIILLKSDKTTLAVLFCSQF